MGIADTPSPARTLLVADSFRVRTCEGVAKVRGFPHHLERFRRSVLARLPAASALANAVGDSPPLTEQDVDVFIAAALPRVAASGEGFPRLELWRELDSRLSLSLELRPLPELRDKITLVSDARPGNLTRPQAKGPNIASYSALMQRTGGEVLLLDESGAIVEGTTTSLIWWHADGTGGYSAARDRVSSVTELLARGIAQGFGDELRPERRTPTELAHLDVWAVNALHGIRPVAGIDGRELTRQDPDRLARYRVALDGAWDRVLP